MSLGMPIRGEVPPESPKNELIAEDDYVERKRIEVETELIFNKWNNARKVNSQLQTALMDKNAKVEELVLRLSDAEEAIRLSTTVESPMRKAIIVALENDAMMSQQLSQDTKLSLGKTFLNKEEKVQALTKVTDELRKTGTRNREKIKIKSAEVKRLIRKVAEVRRHLAIIEGDETPLARSYESNSDVTSVSLMDEQGVRVFRGERHWTMNEAPPMPPATLLSVAELKNLPGLNIELLLSDTFSARACRNHSPERNEFVPNENPDFLT